MEGKIEDGEERLGGRPRNVEGARDGAGVNLSKNRGIRRGIGGEQEGRK